MRAEHIRQCIWEATRDKDTDADKWEKVVALVQAAFQEG